MTTKYYARPRFTFSDQFQQRLNSYALAASAAGVGILALTQPAQAKIIFTHAHKVIDLTHNVALDLNHDGKIDFNFHETFITTTSVGEFHSIILSVLPARKANRIWGTGHEASALAAGIRVGPKGRFSYGKEAMAFDVYADGTGGSGTCGGPWNNVHRRYLGFKFSIKGKTHFGWARLNVACITTFEDHEVNATLTGYAYETVPNKPILTGKTKGPDNEATAQALPAPPHQSTLGALAMGSRGLAIWRREESAAADSQNN